MVSIYKSAIYLIFCLGFSTILTMDTDEKEPQNTKISRIENTADSHTANNNEFDEELQQLKKDMEQDKINLQQEREREYTEMNNSSARFKTRIDRIRPDLTILSENNKINRLKLEEEKLKIEQQKQNHSQASGVNSVRKRNNLFSYSKFSIVAVAIIGFGYYLYHRQHNEQSIN